MITKKYLEIYKCSNHEEFFDYVISLRHQGERFKMFKLIRKMSKFQAMDFIEYVFMKESDRFYKEWSLDILDTKLWS